MWPPCQLHTAWWVVNETGKEVTFVLCMVCRGQKLLGVCMPLWSVHLRDDIVTIRSWRRCCGCMLLVLYMHLMQCKFIFGDLFRMNQHLICYTSFSFLWYSMFMYYMYIYSVPSSTIFFALNLFPLCWVVLFSRSAMEICLPISYGLTMCKHCRMPYHRLRPE